MPELHGRETAKATIDQNRKLDARLNDSSAVAVIPGRRGEQVKSIPWRAG
jgi:hypothetical protein